jgi:hypothetical protein
VKKYCFDTSGFSNPLEAMPEDIHDSMWTKVKAIIADGQIAVTAEIYDEMERMGGDFGQYVKDHKAEMLLEVGHASWDWSAYKVRAAEIQTAHHDFISEYCGGSPKTVCLNDISIIALAKSLSLPLVSMESPVRQGSRKRRIPDVCLIEGVQPLNFNQFLRAEGIRI